MSDRGRAYSGQAIVVQYGVKRCIHAAECAKGLPAVFDPNRQPWIDPDAASADDIAAIVMRCPTGALHFERTDGGAAEPVPDRNRTTLSADGPLYLRGQIEIARMDGTVLLHDTRVALCRCGASQNKPFCDGHHETAGFTDPGQLGTNQLKPVDPTAAGALRVTLAPNGPLLFNGPFELCAATGTACYAGSSGALCRCGASQNKPFCDGSHKTIGFAAE